MIAVIGLWIAAGLLAIAILAIIVSGVRGLVNRNLDVKKIGSILVPIVIYIVVLLISSDWAKAGLVTMVIMIGLMVVSIFATGIRGLFT